MSIIKTVEYHNGETGESMKGTLTVLSDMAVRFKIGNGKGNHASRFSKVFQMEDPKFEVGSYYQYFFRCLLHLEMETNRIVLFTKDRSLSNKPMTELDLVNLFQTGHKTVKNFLNYCKEKDIIAKISKNDELYGYIVNPLYALNGNKINSMLYTMFRNTGLDEHIPQQDLYKLQEYLSMQNKIEENIFLKN